MNGNYKVVENLQELFSDDQAFFGLDDE